MDESWRMKMGMPSLISRRRVSEDMTSWTSAESGWSSGLFGGSEAGAMDAEDFNDVFGGPPRSVLSRKLSCDFTNYDYFYNEIFRRPEAEEEPVRSARTGRRLPEFRIPSRSGPEEKARFYNDVFGSSGDYKADDDDDHREKKSISSSRLWRSMSMSKWTSKSKSKSKSKSNSSSVLSYEEFSPLPIRPGTGEEDAALTSFAAKLRPINVPCRWNSSSAMEGNHKNQSSETPFQCSHSSYMIENHYPQNEYNDEHFMRSSNPDLSQQFPSPEANIPHSTTVGISVDDVGELESPSSAKSVFCHDLEASKAKFRFSGSYEQRGEEEDDDEVFSSYVIEINSREREVTNEDADINEAIAWAKEKFQGCSSSGGELNDRQHENNYQFREFEERSMVPMAIEVPANVSERYPIMPLYMEAGFQHSVMQEDDHSSGKNLGILELDERVDSWSAGKETNIRLLLSTLHHILWTNSGWSAIPLSNLIESSQVKKAYQKARLCIHPDKLQQRGATPLQKYVANKAFSVLQNAWDAFISQEIFFN